jgi:hypothetical protein
MDMSSAEAPLGIVVMVESPYSGDIPRNIRYLQLCHIDAAKRNEIPYSSHSYMTQHPLAKDFFVPDDNDKWDILTRDVAINQSQVIRWRCDMSVFYTDRGWSRGMIAARDYCQRHGLAYEERTLDVDAVAIMSPLLTREVCQAIINGNYEKFLQ